MASTKIRYNSKGFWIPEEFIELLSEYICQAFESIGINTFSENLKEIYETCSSNRHGGRVGMVNISMDGYINGNSEKLEFLQVLNQTKVLLSSLGTELS